MLVVHGLWRTGGRLALWGEDSTLAARAPRRAGRPPRERPHPFAATHQALTDALGEAAIKAASGSALMHLPTQGGAPLDSPELVRTQPVEPARGSLALATWRVPVVEFDIDGAVAVLERLRDGDVVPGAVPGAACAADLRHLIELARFAVDLVGRGRILPTVASTGGEPTAVWRPLLTAGDAEWARALA
ncbi:MAG TPA: ATP-dependent helicase, partial [Micromonosporaceae bacterium]